MTESASPQPIRVIVVDDDPIVRSALVAYVSQANDLAVIRSCENGEQAVAAVAEDRPDVVVMDIRMPVLDGINATTRIRKQHPDTRVLLLTSFDDDEFMLSALQAGAAGFLLKDSSPKAVVDAVHAVHEGTTVVSPEPLGRFVRTRGRPGPRVAASHPNVDLSHRELEILRLLCQAHSNAEIAAELYLSESTVKTHVSAIMSKLMVKSRLKAVVRAYEWGLVDRDDG